MVLVLLSLSVVLTLVLFVLSRSVTDIAVSSREGEAIRAFSAAEAGVEKALIVGSSIGKTTIGDAEYNADVTDFAEGLTEFIYPVSLASGDASTLWFVNHDDNGNPICDVTHPCFSGNSIKICWGKEDTGSSSATTPAVELSAFWAATPGNYATLRIGRAAFDPYSTRRNSDIGGASPNRFSAPDAGTCTIDGETFAFQKTVNFAGLGITSAGSDNGLQFAKVRMFYNTNESHKVAFAVSGGDVLPSQGLMVSSAGSSGEANRRLEVFQGWPEAPFIFDYSIYSSTGLTK